MDTALDSRNEHRVEINDQSLLYCSDGSGEVVDISMKGLSFRHLTGSNWPTGAFKIDLLLDNSTLLIEQIPCALIYPDSVTPDNRNRWRHALEFGTLSTEQNDKLKEYLTDKKKQRASLTSI